MTATQTRSVSLYIHVPFCRARCLYCAFPARPAGPSTQTQYVECLCGEMEKYFESAPDARVDTVYVGGGTPSTLGIGDLELLLAAVRQLAPDASEITMEVNPHPDDLPKIPILLENGVNRLSIGVQSFNDEELSLAGRLHDSEDTRQFIKACRECGCSNMSFDLMQGLPGQDIESFRSSLEEATGFEPEHISLYSLTVESESRLGRLPERQFRTLNLPDGDDQARMYDLARQMLRAAGYEQYEISNFSKPGYRCRHNMVYWSGGEYVGFGPSATSYVGGARFRRISNVDGYLEAQAQGKNTIEFMESLCSRRSAAEALVMGLRLSSGIDPKRIETRFGVKLTDLVGEALEKYRDEGLLVMDDESIRLTEGAYFVSNAIFREIIK